MASFAARVAAASGAWPSVSWHFDSNTKRGPLWLSENLPDNTPGWGYAPGNLQQNPYPSNGTQLSPEIDLTEGCTTAGALKFTRLSQMDANASGSWIAKFSHDDSVSIGIVAEDPTYYDRFYAQCRCKWNRGFTDTVWLNTAGGYQGGIKIFDSHAGFPLGVSSEAQCAKFVVQTIGPILGGISPLSRHMHGYGYGYDGQTHPYATVDYDFQNDRAAPYCRYPDWLNCWDMPADEYITFTIYQRILDRVTYNGNPGYVNFEAKLWVQNDGQSRIQLLHHDPGVPGYQPMPWRVGEHEAVNRLMLFPYMTDQSPGQICPTSIAWYDEVIIGPNDPGSADAVSFSSGGIVTPPPPPPPPPVQLHRSRFRKIG